MCDSLDLHQNRPLIVDRLTARELDVLRLMADWQDNDEIAASLFVSINTVKTHAKSIHRKLGTTTRRETVRVAQCRGLVGCRRCQPAVNLRLNA